MNTHRRRGGSRGTAILALCLAVVLASVLTAQEGSGDSIRVCTFPAEGFFVRDAGGVASGLEYDILTGFASAAKLKIEYENVPQFDQLLADTQKGRCQIAAATISVTDERKTRLAFTTPYFPNRVLMIQKATTEFTKPSDLKDRRVAVVKGTVSAGLVGNIPGAKAVLVDDDDAAFQTLLKGNADALACDSAIVLHYLTKSPELAIAFPVGERSFFAFALPKDSKLLAPLNDHLKSITRSGVFTKLLAKHFGEDNAELLAEDVAKAIAKP